MRRLLVAAMLLISGLAAADTRYVEEQAGLCFDCHGPGSGPNPMDPAFTDFPMAANGAVGETFAFRAELLNAWLADQLDVYMTLDLREAPSLAFVGAMTSNATSADGRIVMADPSQATRVHRASVALEVPLGTTALRVALHPEDDGPLAPDLSMHVYGSRSDKPAFTIDEGGPGEPEVLRVEDPVGIASLGYGLWRIEAELTPVQTSSLAPGNEWPFTARIQTWANTSLERQQVAFQAGPVGPGGREVFAWDVVVQSPPAPNERVGLVANSTMYYRHNPGESPYDWDNITRAITTPVRAVDGGASLGFDTNGGTIGAPTVGVSMASVSEAIGYASAMLLIASMVTGGMFGKASRRHLNTVFGSARRRVAFHNFLSYGIVVAALAHMTIFIVDAIEPMYPWQRGVLWGGTGILCMLGLGVTGAMQVPMIRRWDYATWRRIHFGLALATVAFTIIHMLLDGAHFGAVQETVGWDDPLVPADKR